MTPEILKSKKFLAMIAGVVLAIASRAGLDLDPDMVDRVLALVGVYILGQGIADRGKEAAKVNAMEWTPIKTDTVLSANALGE